MMRTLIVKGGFFISGLVNLLPAIGVLGGEQLRSLYDVSIAGDDLLLLMRHRAVLLGLVGGVLIVAAFRPVVRTVAGTLGLLSMSTFLVLALPLSMHGAAVQRVFWVDVGAIIVLLVAWLTDRRGFKG